MGHTLKHSTVESRQRNDAPAREPEHIPDSFDSPESSFIKRAEYDRGQMVLTVRIERNHAEHVYIHGAVPGDVWDRFYQAQSKGSYYNKQITPMFPGRLVGS